MNEDASHEMRSGLRTKGSKTMRKKLIAGAVVAICLSLLAYSTSAYFTTEKTATNVITSGNIDIQLQETAMQNGEEVLFEQSQEKINVMPSQTVSKIVRVENTGTNAAYVRISVSKSIALAEGVHGTPNVDLLKLDFDSENWTAKDGYYYYNRPLAPGELTEPLFNSVTFSPSMGNMYQNSTATIKVKAQATQVKNNGASATDAEGWPASE